MDKNEVGGWVGDRFGLEKKLLLVCKIYICTKKENK
jgi:hypothetical protein